MSERHVGGAQARLVPPLDEGAPRSRARIAAVTIPLGLAASLYAATLCRWVLPGDPAELVTAAVTLGLAHPTGYPLYLLAAKTASSIVPWLRPELVVNAMSSLCTVTMLALVAVCLERLGCSSLVTGVSVCLLAFTPSLWRYSTYAEVYTFHGLLMSCVILAGLHAGARRPWVGAYLLGLSTGTHMTGLLALPGLAVWSIAASRPQPRRRTWAMLASMAIAFLLGATVLLALLFFDRPDRINYLHGIELWRPDSGLTTAWSRFVYIVSARQFNALAGVTTAFSDGGLAVGAGSAVKQLLRDQPVAIALGLLGLCVPWKPAGRRARGLRLYLVSLVALQLLYFATYRRFFQPIFFLPSTVALTFGVAQLLERGVRGSARTVATLAIAGWVLFTVVRSYETRDLSHESAPQTATRKVMEALEPDAVIFSTWTSSTLFWFHQWVEGVQPGIDIVNALPQEWMARTNAFAGRPLYFEKIPPGARREEFTTYRGLHKLVTNDRLPATAP